MQQACIYASNLFCHLTEQVSAFTLYLQGWNKVLEILSDVTNYLDPFQGGFRPYLVILLDYLSWGIDGRGAACTIDSLGPVSDLQLRS